MENAERILCCLREFGFGSLGLTIEDFTFEDQVVRLGVPPVRIDLLTKLSGSVPVPRCFYEKPKRVRD